MYSALSYNFGNLQDKLNVFLATAPVANLKNSPNSMIVDASKYWKQLESTAKTFKMYEIRNPKFDTLMRTFCGTFSDLCSAITAFLNMESSPYNVKSREEVIDARPGSSASLNQIVHYGQLANSGVFKQYDWGSDKANIEHYGTKVVPLITLEKIKKVPVAMFVGLQDPLADPTDTKLVKKKCETLSFYKEYNNMDHSSFNIGKDMSWINDVIAQLKKVTAEDYPDFKGLTE